MINNELTVAYSAVVRENGDTMGKPLAFLSYYSNGIRLMILLATSPLTAKDKDKREVSILI